MTIHQDIGNAEAMKHFSSLLTSLLGLGFAGLFLYLAFGGIDFQHMRGLLSRVSMNQVALMVLLCLGSLIVRGLRWYFLLPTPYRRGELWAAQRALGMSYGVNNLLSRVGELARIWIMKRDSGRSIAALTASVAVDRLAFDSLFFGVLVGSVLIGFHGPLVQAIPQLESAFGIFVAITLLGILSMLLLTLFPQRFKLLVSRLGLRKIGFLRLRIDPIIDQLAIGLAVLARPRELLGLHFINLVAWSLAYFHFWVALSCLDIEITFGQSILLFTITSFGFLLPSPGGVGAFHYFMVLGATTLLSIDREAALAAATLCHGLNYLVVSVWAMVCFGIKANVIIPAPAEVKTEDQPIAVSVA